MFSLMDGQRTCQDADRRRAARASVLWRCGAAGRHDAERTRLGGAQRGKVKFQFSRALTWRARAERACLFFPPLLGLSPARAMAAAAEQDTRIFFVHGTPGAGGVPSAVCVPAGRAGVVVDVIAQAWGTLQVRMR
jgi:hypothetical protein